MSLMKIVAATLGAAAVLLAVAPEARADLIVASGFTDQVLQYDGATGAFQGVFAQGGGLDGPSFLAFSPAAVPEPASLVLIGTGVAGLLAFPKETDAPVSRPPNLDCFLAAGQSAELCPSSRSRGCSLIPVVGSGQPGNAI